MSTRFFPLNRDRVRVLLQILLSIAALLLSFLILLGDRWRVDGDLAAQTAGTKTAIALMTGVLLGPTPTSTAPTTTPSDLPTMTSPIALATSSATRTPIDIPTATLFASAAPRTRQPRPTDISTFTPVVPTTGATAINTPVRPTLTPIRPTDTAVAPPTDTQPAPATATEIPILTIIPTIQLP